MEPDQKGPRLFFSTMLKWLLWGGIIGVGTGTASAFLLEVNDFLGTVREAEPWLLLLLPLGGLGIGFLYKHYGKDSTKGNNLIWEHVQHGQGKVPLRMGPLVFVSTFITVLFGGSTGREGAAIQMGSSIAEGVNRLFKVHQTDRKILIISGISGGFGSAFGAPVTGAVFGMEAMAIGKMGYEAIVPSFTASFIGHLVTTAWGVKHEHFVIQQVPPLVLGSILQVIVAAIAFGLVSMLYSQLRHAVEKYSILYLRDPMLRGLVGGITIIALTYLVGSQDYLGRGIETIKESFTGVVSPLAFLAKLVFTAVTMGTGFRGGEVIPLSFIGSTLGNSLSLVLNLPVPFLAALGFVAVFCGAANTPLAAFIFSIELFEGKGVAFFFLACLVSFLASGHHGIYPSQKLYEPKSRLFGLAPGQRISAIEKEPSE